MKTAIIACSLLMSSYSFAKPLIIGGSIASVNDGKGVFQIAIQDKETEDSGFCTATKIGLNSFITAAHCFDDNKNPSDIGISIALTNESFDYDGVEVEKVIIHPSYDESLDEDFSSPDVAIVFVKKNPYFNRIETRELDLNFIQDNQAVEYWGFGCQKTTNSTDDYLPIKKSGTNTTQDVNTLKRNFGAYTQIVHENAETIYSAMILTAGLTLSSTASSLCWGDSGGPVFHKNKIVGINASYLSKEMNEDGTSKSGVTDVNLHVRLSSIKDWILGALKP